MKKIVILLLIVAGFFGYQAHQKNMAPVNFEATGTVVDIEWNLGTDVPPIFTIKTDDDEYKTISHERIVLRSDEVRVGDIFKKYAESKRCFINGQSVTFAR